MSFEDWSNKKKKKEEDGKSQQSSSSATDSDNGGAKKATSFTEWSNAKTGKGTSAIDPSIGAQGWRKYLEDTERVKASAEAEEDDQAWWEKLLGYLGTTPDTSLPMGTTSQVVNDLRVDDSHRKPSDDWNWEQRHQFGALYLESPAKAYDYATKTNAENKKAKEEAEIKAIQDSATSSFGAGLGHTIAAVATAPMGLADYLADIAEANARGTITNDGMVSPFEYSQAVTSGIGTHLNEKGGTLSEDIPIIGGKGWGDVYSVGTSIAQSMASAYTLGGTGTLISYFGQGAAAGVDDAMSRGASEEQAVLYGTALGVFEGLAEKIGVDNLFKLGSTGRSAFIKDLLKQAGAEGMEEGLTSLFSNIADNAIMQDKSNFNAMVQAYMAQGMSESDAKTNAWWDSVEGIAFDTITGSISGGVHGGIHTGAHTVFANIDAKKTYGGQEKALVGKAREIGTADTIGLADKYQSRLDKGKSLTGAQLRTLVEANERGVVSNDTTKIASAAEARLAELGETGDAKALAGILAKQVAGETLSRSEKALLEGSKYGKRVANELDPKKALSGEYTSSWVSDIGTERVNSLVYKLAREVAGATTEEDSASKPVAEKKYDVSESGKTTYGGKEVAIAEVADVKDGEVYLRLEGGETVKASEVAFASDDEALIYEMVANTGGSVETANELIGAFSSANTPANTYAVEALRAYQYGRMGIEQSLEALAIPEAQRKIAYNRGRIDAMTDAEQRPTSKASSPSSKRKINGIIYEGKGLSARKKTSVQSASIKAIEALAKISPNIEFHVYSSMKSGATRVAYIDGKPVKNAPNGYFTAGNKIYIDLNAGQKGEGVMLYTLSHEITHYIRAWNAKGFKTLADFLFKHYGENGVSIDAFIEKHKEQIVKRLEREGATIPSEAKLFDMAYEEVVADAMSSMLADPKAYEKLAELKAQDKTVFEKLGEAIKKILDKLKELLGIYSEYTPDAKEAAPVGKFAAEVYEQLQDLYLKAFVDADANYEASLLTTEETTDPVPVEETTQYSYRSLAEAAGFEAVENEDGSRSFVRDGKAVSEVTVEDIENSPIGAFINFSLEQGDIDKENADKQKEMFAKICTMACKTNDFSMTMQFVGSAVFTGMKANADKQYGTTYDFPSICTKTQAVIDAMSAKMVKLGRGLNSEEIVELYREVFASGNPVPCPECYVFSRWIGIGGLLDNIKKYQDYYGSMPVADVAKAYRKMRSEVEAFAEEQGLSFGKAKGALTAKLTKEFNKLTEKIEKATNQGEAVKETDRKRLADLEPMMNTVKAMTWLENVYFADSSLTKVNKNFRVPNEVLFDLNNGEAFATQYPEAWAFRTTQGAGYGKAITPYAEARLGEGVLVTNSPTNAIKGKAQGTLKNYFLQQRGKLDAKARKALLDARAKQRNQAFIGGQRFQSTSDARYENASDYLLAALEMQAMHGMVQVYTKVDGAVPAFANWGFSINQSLMPLGGGLDADGTVKDTSVGGMNPRVALENRQKHETAGTITIGVNDKHIRTLFLLLGRDFVIPYHASGGKADIVAEFRMIQDRAAKRNAKVRSTDYSRTQSDKVLSDDVLKWLGKSDAEIERIHKVREARIAILTRGKPNMDVVRSNDFLSALYDKLNGGEWHGVKLAKGKVESQIYPNEFWDKSVSYEDSGKVTRDYLQYCDDLGFLHRFSGLVPSNGMLVPVKGYDQNGHRVVLTDLAYKYDENGQKTDEIEDFFWKVLTDRRMYDNSGAYLPQKTVTLNDTTADTVTGFAKNNDGRQYDKKVSQATASRLADTMFSDRDSDTKYSDRVLMGSLFSGGGTLEAGLTYQMLDKEFAVEYNKKIASVYTDNHGKEHMFVGDVQDFNSKDKQSVFYLHASPVCKNFSPASHSGGETTLDITTAQATARVLEEQMPQVFTVENVKRYIGSEAYNIITAKLDELGYTWDVDVYKASDYGNATKRERMIIRAVRSGQLPAKPQKVSTITSWGEATRDLWETELIPSNLVKSKIEAIKNTPQLKGVRLTKLDKPLLIYDTTKSKTVNFAWADELAPTLTTKCGDARIIMPDGRVYAPTPKFMGRIQGLPDDYKYPKAVTNAFKIIGNGIPTQLTKAVMGGVLDSAYEQTHDGEVLYSDRDSEGSKLEERDYTVSEIHDLFNRWNSDSELSALADKVFAKLDSVILEQKEQREREHSYLFQYATQPYEIRVRNADYIRKRAWVNRGVGVFSAKRGDGLYGITFDSDGLAALDSQTRAQVLLHEAIHAVTVKAIEDVEAAIPKDTPLYTDFVAPSDWSEEQKGALALLQIYQQVGFSGYLGKKVHYGEESVYEMVAELSNPEFRQYLKKKSLWARVIEAIKRILGLDTGNALDATSKALERILDAGMATSDQNISYSERVTDQETLDFLEEQEHVTVYRAMQYIDGKLYPPMNAYTYDENGKKVLMAPSEIGAWEQAVERPDLIDPKTGKFKLDKGKVDGGARGTVVPAAYNPYIHTSLSMLNDQFTSAYTRSNLVVVKGVVPKSELTSGYRAQFAKDSVGETEWHSGVVSTQLPESRKVILSRWFKPVEVMDNDVVAKHIKKMLGNTGIEIPYNVVSPKLRRSLEKIGVPIGEGRGIRNLPKKSEVLYQERDTDSVSTRSLLANALESAAQNDIERKRLAEYKKKIALIEQEQAKLSEIRSQIRELSFAKGPRDTARIRSLQFDEKQAANRINTYDRQLLNLQSTEALKRVLEHEKKKAYKKAEKEGKEALERYREKMAKTQRELLTRARDQREKAVERVREGRDKREAREKLQELVLKTTKWLTAPGKDEVKCPDFLAKPYAEFLDGIDLSSKRLLEGGDPTKNDLRLSTAMTNLANAIERATTAQNPEVDVNNPLDAGYLDLPEDFIWVLREMAESITSKMDDSDYVINRMSSADIKQVSQLIRTLNHAIREMSTLYKNLRFANAQGLGAATTGFLESMGKAKGSNGVSDFVQWDNALPFYAFKRFGEGGESIFEELMDAQDKLAHHASAIFSFKDKTWTDKEAKEWGNDVHDIRLPSGGSLTMTTAQAMGIYCLSLREAGKRHLLGGGTRVLGLKKGAKKASDSRSTLTEADLDAIVSSLSERQKKVALDMQKFMATVCAEWGNEISMKRFLRREFTDPHYYPIESNDENLNTQDPKAQQGDLYRLLNISATKELNPRANNEVIIRDIFEVFTEHASDMARLNAFGLALLDYMKWVNYRERTVLEGGQIKTRGVKKAINETYEGAAWKYVLGLIRDINGRHTDNGDNPFLMGMMRLQKTASVGNNLRVAFLQFTSYPRASMVLSSKSLALGLTKKPQIEKAKKYCGIALWKSFGFYDTNIARSVEEQIKGTQNIRQKLIELSMKGPEFADAITWGALWNACEYEVAKTTKSKVGSEEFNQEVGLKLREVVYSTQVVDSVLTRSQIMRSKSGITQLATAYMSEPTLSANILMDAKFQFHKEKRISGSPKAAWGKTRKIVFKAVGNFCTLALITSIAESLADAWRDDDDEEFLEKFKKAFVGNLLSNAIPFNKIPILSDVVDLLLHFVGVGYVSSDNLATSWITQAATAFDVWAEVLGEKFGDKDSEDYKETSKTVYNAIYKTAKVISSMTGVSVSGVMREVVAVWNNTAGEYDSTLKIKQYEPTSAELGNGLYKAIIEGDTRQADSIKALFDGQKDIDSAIRKALRENDPRIKEAAKARNNGDIAEYMRIAKSIIAEGHFSQDNVVAAINAEISAMNNGETTSTTSKEKGLFEMKDYYAAIVDRDQATAAAVKEDIIRTDVKNGKDRDEAEKSFVSSFVSHCREKYEDGELSDRDAVSMLTKYADKSDEEAANKVQYWAFTQDYPDYDDLTESAVGKYYSDVEPYGIGVEVYYDYTKLKAKCEGTDEDGDGETDRGSLKREVMRVIHSLPITKRQKDALYYLNGWAESSIHEAPWR